MTATTAAARLDDLRARRDELRAEYGQALVAVGTLRREVALQRRALIDQALALAHTTLPRQQRPRGVHLDGTPTETDAQPSLDEAAPHLAARIRTGEPGALIEAGVPVQAVDQLIAREARLRARELAMHACAQATRDAADYFDRALRAAGGLGIYLRG